ncbi:MAG TPA: hypothetical protein VHT75_07705 [Acidimicrobiales bacterium]|nr:hypothetical protein [Acidimicrobiales bacterium]
MTQAARWLIVLVPAALLAGCSSGHANTGGRSATTPSVGTSPTTAAVTPTAPVPGVTGPAPEASTTSAAAATTPVATSTPAPAGTTIPAGPPSAATGKGGIAGHVYAGCGSGPPSGAACQTQTGVAGDTITVTSGGATVATAITSADGGYRVDVPAGLYGLEESKGRQTTRVQVDAGLIVVANFTVS